MWNRLGVGMGEWRMGNGRGIWGIGNGGWGWVGSIGDGKWGGGEAGRRRGGEAGRWGDEDWEMGNGRREGHNCDERTKKPQREIET